MDEEIRDRVRIVIERLELSNKQFAATIGLDEDKLSKALNGKRRFSSFELASMAELGSTTVDWLLSGDVSKSLGLAARATGVDVQELQTASEAITARFARANDVLRRLDRRGELSDIPTFDSVGSFTRDGQASAEWALEQIDSDLLTGATADLQAAVEAAFDVDIAGTSDLPRGCDGLAFQHDSLRLMILATTPVWTRRRFTLAHELAHLIWRDAESNVLPEQMAPGKINNAFAEKRANAFASAFLMPESAVDNAIGGDDLTDEKFHQLVVLFKVSPSALAVRLSQLGRVDVDRFRQLQTFKSRDSWVSLHEDDSQEVTLASADLPPTRMLLQFLEAYREGVVSAKPLVELTDLEEPIWRRLVHGAPTLSIAPLAESDEELEPAFVP